VNKLDTVLPVGLVESSLTLANVATPLATGASLTAVTDVDKTTVAEEIVVVPPELVPLVSTVVPEVIALAEDSIKRTVRVGAGPLKFAAGKNRSPSAAVSTSADAWLTEAVMLTQLVPVLPTKYCHSPLAVSRV
jgi:hypothetical protein